MNVLFDLDNTIYDLLGGLEDTYPSYKRENQLTYSFRNTKGVEDDDIYELFDQSSFFEGLKPFPNVVETIEELNKLGHTIKFYSSCNNKGVYNVKEAKLKKDFSFKTELIWADRTSLCDLDFDLVVDDNIDRVKIIFNLHPTSFAVIQEHKYNSGLRGNRVRYLDPLSNTYKEDFLTLVKELSTSEPRQD